MNAKDKTHTKYALVREAFQASKSGNCKCKSEEWQSPEINLLKVPCSPVHLLPWFQNAIFNSKEYKAIEKCNWHLLLKDFLFYGIHIVNSAIKDKFLKK